MPTVKRQIPDFNLSTSNPSRHTNIMELKGIMQDKNFFNVDQMSVKNALNVYIDDDKTLISRPPIILDELPDAYVLDGAITTKTDIVPEGYSLIDIEQTERIVIYVSKKDDGTIRIVAYSKERGGLLQIINKEIKKYHISFIENYVVAFNDADAVVLDIDEFDKGWVSLRDMSEIPVTKRIVGQDVFTNPGNQFTDAYKEEYVWGEYTSSILPEGNAEVTVHQLSETYKWKLENANINSEFRLLRPLNMKLEQDDVLSAEKNINTGIISIAIARDGYFLLSLDGGHTFTKILYPVHIGYKGIGALSKDGLCFFFVSKDGVYRYSIGDTRWTVFRLSEFEINGQILNRGTYYFNNAETFSFILYESKDEVPITRLYYKGPGLKYKEVDEEGKTLSEFKENELGMIVLFSGNLNPSLQEEYMGRTDVNNYAMFMNVEGETDNLYTIISMWLPLTGENSVFVSVIGNTTTDNVQIVKNIMDPSTRYGGIYSVTPRFKYDEDKIKNMTFRGVDFAGFMVDGLNNWIEIEGTVGEYDKPSTTEEYQLIKAFDYEITYHITGDENAYEIDGAPISLGTGHIINMMTYSLDGQALLPTELDGVKWPDKLLRKFTVPLEGSFFMGIDDKVYTNYMTALDNVVITYTRPSTTMFNKVPNVSHVNNELYLGFDSTLKITANDRDGAKIKFFLPEINNNTFTSNVTAMINISTTEVAVYLENQIYLVVQTADEVFGYRYDYFNTRLSVGVRLGDDVINTRDGIYTLYPTRQGLAVMNYQSNVAATDQIVEYVTKNVTNLWNEFYESGDKIRITQMKDYVWLSNGTQNYIMFDLRNMSWWRFKSPVPITKFITDQFDLSFIGDNLYKIDKDFKVYYDLGKVFIDWNIESQPLHFNAPSHYKNLKQLIFMLEQSTTTRQTLLTQIKLYRKNFTIREPEVIEFKIEEYRTFIKRFNYWKINELQWALGADKDTATQAQLKLNGITIKYEIGEEVRS